MAERVEIVRLSADAPHLERVAAWQHAEWSHLSPGETQASRLAALRGECGRAGVPSVFVAIAAGRPVGTASLVAHDLDSRPDLTPWLASVYVRPEWRGRGIASSLVRRVEAEASGNGIERLYLFTPDRQALYRRLGWADHETLRYRGETVTLMTRRLIPPNA
ncbi:GNAT family N-acetyltransferase [Halomonas ventosae]|uniref:Acetyltransferase (GNAT) family protein n=1 Tax=Halomonas ventosae TaxID=229007 RepID=A0A2T0VCG0_9GAMM|nr:GNAT family N-acetyltransferase [Halomonas ventosae]PRY67801.1 acetyltransferase (GNAT) family protein [Halomonas ventosae]